MSKDTNSCSWLMVDGIVPMILLCDMFNTDIVNILKNDDGMLPDVSVSVSM